MKSFTYTITHPMGIHAQVVSQLAMLAKQYPDTILEVEYQGRKARLDQVMKMMSLAVKCGSTVTVSATGTEPGETESIVTLQEFFRENL